MISAHPTTVSLAPRYDRATIYLHWATAALVAVLWGTGQTTDFFPKGDMRDGYRTLHFAFGVMLVAVVFIRLMWRIGGGRKLPDARACSGRWRRWCIGCSMRCWSPPWRSGCSICGSAAP
jgi:cytochrome b561